MTLKSQFPQVSAVGPQEGSTQRGQGCFAGRAARHSPAFPRREQEEAGRSSRPAVPSAHGFLPHSSRAEGFGPESPMKATEHMNKNIGDYYALSSTASRNGLLVKMVPGVYSKAFSDISEKKHLK